MVFKVIFIVMVSFKLKKIMMSLARQKDLKVWQVNSICFTLISLLLER